MRGLATLAVMVALGGVSSAASAEEKVIGSWYILREQDKFTDVDNFIVATHKGDYGLGFRCQNKEYSVVVLDTENGGFTPGEKFKIIYRVDKGPIQTAEGEALSKSLIQEGENVTKVSEILGKKEITLRIKRPEGRYTDVTFPLFGALQAFSTFVKQCPE